MNFMYVGNTVMLTAEFKDEQGNYYAPTNRLVKIFNNRLGVIEEGEPEIEDVGKYYYYYTLTEDDYMFEFSGIDAEGYPVAKPGRLQTTKLFIKG